MIGGAGKKISRMVDLAEDLYERVNDLRARVESMTETVEGTADRVERLEGELAEQRALVAAIAEEQGIDVEAITETAAKRESQTSGATESAESGARDAEEPTPE